jgi:hypothetical protein
MKAMFLFLILAPLTFGQSVVKPLRVSITTDERDSQYRVFAGRMRAELTRAGRVAIVPERATHHYNLVLSASPITTDASCKGFVAAMVVSSAAGVNNLSVHVGDRYDTMARAMVEKLEEEYFHVDVNDDGFIGPKVEGGVMGGSFNSQSSP